MPLPVNGARGEVALRVGSVDLVVAAEIGRLAAVSTALECKSFSDLYQRILGVELAATLAAIRHLTVRGNADAAIKQLTIRDLAACRNAFAASLNHFLGDEGGKADAVDEGATA
jgi:hypothetical protein